MSVSSRTRKSHTPLSSTTAPLIPAPLSFQIRHFRHQHRIRHVGLCLWPQYVDHTSLYQFTHSLVTRIPQDQKLTAHQDLGVKVATPVGTFVGQLLFGWLADVLGRKRMCQYPPAFSLYCPST